DYKVLQKNLKSGILNSSGYLKNSFSQANSQMNSRLSSARASTETRINFSSTQQNLLSPGRNGSNKIVGPKYDSYELASPLPKRRDSSSEHVIIEEDEEEYVYDRTAKVSFVENVIPIKEYLDKNGD